MVSQNPLSGSAADGREAASYKERPCWQREVAVSFQQTLRRLVSRQLNEGRIPLGDDREIVVASVEGIAESLVPEARRKQGMSKHKRRFSADRGPGGWAPGSGGGV